ncbi:MAG: glycosyltransferase [Nitrospinota bacterium]
MIYVTVGNHDQPFDRLVKAMDALAGKLGMEAVIQKGVSAYAPQNARWKDFYAFDESETFFKNADAVVGHAGIGTVISARKWNTPLVICPRRKLFGEHFNDHQMEISQELIKNPRPLVEVAMEVEEIEDKLASLLEKSAGDKAVAAEGGASAEGLKKAIKDFLNGL